MGDYYCTNCGADLEDQFGFDPDSGHWTCTECGHTNNLSEDEIYESEEDYQNSKNDDYGGSLFGAIAKGFVDGIN